MGLLTHIERMKIFFFVQALAISLLLTLSLCHAGRAFMWTDEQGVAHISDQAPPKGVEATSFSTDTDHPEAAAGEAEDKQQVPSQRIGSGSDSTKNDRSGKGNPPSPADNTRQEVQKAPKPKYRDEASLSRDEKVRLLFLDASKQHATKLYGTSSSEDERRRWKAELDKIQAEEKKILEVGNK
jgi:hypothetical protein